MEGVVALADALQRGREGELHFRQREVRRALWLAAHHALKGRNEPLAAVLLAVEPEGERVGRRNGEAALLHAFEQVAVEGGVAIGRHPCRQRTALTSTQRGERLAAVALALLVLAST